MGVKLRLSASAIALLLPGLLLARWTLSAGSAGSVPDLVLPGQVGEWRVVEDDQLDPDVVAMVEPDAYRLRLYETPGKTPIWIYVAIYAGRAGYGKGAHDPEVCYPATGWEILSSRSLDLPVSETESLRAELISVHKGVEKQSAIYWFQPAERWPAGSTAEQLLRVVDALFGQPQYAFVRISGHAGEQAVRELSEFAGEIAPAIRSSVARVGTESRSRPETAFHDRLAADGALQVLTPTRGRARGPRDEGARRAGGTGGGQPRGPALARPAGGARGSLRDPGRGRAHVDRDRAVALAREGGSVRR